MKLYFDDKNEPLYIKGKNIITLIKIYLKKFEK